MISKIIHILQGTIHMDCVIDVFEKTSVTNTFVSIANGTSLNLLNNYGSADIRVLNKDEIVPFIIKGGYQLVVFHSLTSDKYDLVLQIPKHIKIVWSSLGFDIYQPWMNTPPVLPIELYKPITKKLLNPVMPLKKRIVRLAKEILFYNKYRAIRTEQHRILYEELDLQQRLLQRIDYMATVLPTEFELLSRLESFKASYFPFQYVSGDEKDTENIKDTASLILLGNSATPTNNHLDVLHILKERNILNKCVMPCSYGGTHGNAEYFTSLKQIVGPMANVQIHDSFMPIDEYTKFMKSCRIGIFGHLRQQAIGNIVLCMTQGCKVFLWRDSVTYRYFKEAGYIVYTIEDDLTAKNIEKLMTYQEREINKRKLFEQFAFAPVVERLNKILCTI